MLGKKTAGLGRGSIWREIEKLYNVRMTKRWETYVREIISRYLQMFKKSTWVKPNRKLPRDFRGKRRLPHAKIFIYIDVSGSISKDEYHLFLSHAQHLLKLGDAEVVFWDDGIESAYSLRRGERINLKVKGTVGGGGTYFSKVIDVYKDKTNYYSLNFVLTDGLWLDLQVAIEKLEMLKGKKILLTSEKVVEGFDEVYYL
jgi:predicted metal-dependent peptidase